MTSLRKYPLSVVLEIEPKEELFLRLHTNRSILLNIHSLITGFKI